MKLRVIGILFVAVFSSSAGAKFYTGGLAGLSLPDHRGTSARLAYALLGGYRFDNNLGFGLYYLSSSKEESADGARFDFNYDLTGVEGNYHVPVILEGAYLGARVGLSKVRKNTSDYSPTHYGFLVGYDEPFREVFSYGFEISWTRISGDSNVSETLDDFTDVTIGGSLKVWF